MKTLLLLAALSVLLSGLPAAYSADTENGVPPLRKNVDAQPPKTAERGDSGLYWYDGEHRRTLRVDPQWIADFQAAPAPIPRQPGQTDKRDPAETSTTASARSPLKRATVDGKAAAAAAPGVSEVFRDPSGSPRALPGGVIVRLREADLRNARERLVDAGLRPVRALDPEGRSWLVEAPAGRASLELANQLHDSGRFESASPNWWRPRALK